MDYAQRLQERVAARRAKLAEAAENQKKAEEIKNTPLRERNPATSIPTLKIKTQEVTLDGNAKGMTVTIPKVHVVRGSSEEKENSGRGGQASEVLINYKMVHERVEKLKEITCEGNRSGEVEKVSRTTQRENDGTGGVGVERPVELEHPQHDNSSAGSDEDRSEDGQDEASGSSDEEKTEPEETGPAEQEAASPTAQPPVAGDNIMRDAVRDNLHRLGRLYGDANLSSPIHRTENVFNADDESSAASRSIKTPNRSNRLAALASTINSWEDDLRHPQITKSQQATPGKKRNVGSGPGQNDKASGRHVTWGANVGGAQNRGLSFKRVGSFGNEDASSSVVGYQKPDANGSSSLPKKVALDSATMESLEEENKEPPSPKQNGKDKTFSPVSSTTSLTGSSSPCHSPRMGVAAFRSSAQRLPSSTSPDKSLAKSSSVESGISVAACRSSPEKIFGAGSPKMGIGSVCKVVGSVDKRVGLSGPRAGAAGSPRKVDVSPGSVLQKAAAFECHSPSKKTVKDPAELPISERLALFERNKGQPPLPKPAVALAVSKKCEVKKQLPRADSASKVVNAEQKQVLKPDTSSSAAATPSTGGGAGPSGPSSRVLEQLQRFESGVSCDSDCVRAAKEERLKELQALHSRWNKAKDAPAGDERAEVPAGDEKSEMQKGIDKWHKNRKMEGGWEKKQPANNCSPVPSAPPLPSDLQVPSQPQSVVSSEDSRQAKRIASVETRHVRIQSPESQYPAVKDLKKIKVSPPKPGKLYPCLSDIEATTTETETDAADDECQSVSSEDISSSVHDISFGREIMEAAGFKQHQRNINLNLSESSNLSQEESAVCDDMDDFLDEALADDSDSDASAPTPPKKHRISNSPEVVWKNHDSPATSQSNSFEYVHGENASQCPSAKTSGGNPLITLTHTISVYRRQQNMACKGTPVRQVTRRPDCEQYSLPEHSLTARVEADINQKISDLLDEVGKQQTVISQASQALNLCSNTIEFMGSAEQVEGERLLLLATHKRQALLNEIQRLKIEGTLKPKTGSHDNEELFDKGNLTVSHVTLPLKRDYLRQMAADNTCHHYVCLLRCQEQVLATQVLAACPENLLTGSSALVFPGQLRMEGLYGDFKARLEVYTMQTPKEILPHNVKYHIHKDRKDCGKLRLTPKKLMKQDSKLFMPVVQSPAGPSAVRTSNFQMTGFVVFSLREIKRTHFTLNKVTFSSPLEGSVQMRLSSELTLDVTERGFLNLYQDVSGLGSLLRRWFVLKGSRLSYWRYPEEEKSMEPLGYIDLNGCITDLIGLVPRSICTRANTFLLEIRRPTRPDDVDSLVMTVESSHTVVRYFLTADTKEERLQWCYQLNKALAMIRAWGALSSH
ncbi:anillin-like isoform X2 [Bacillus rossius redtenbacheri]|uniref:anillin-like isoform X2 n=1 Tax=Bacillus rossius redtenbacheri TaxID=93214 RepID=UPI002FDEEE0B